MATKIKELDSQTYVPKWIQTLSQEIGNLSAQSADIDSIVKKIEHMGITLSTIGGSAGNPINEHYNKVKQTAQEILSINDTLKQAHGIKTTDQELSDLANKAPQKLQTESYAVQNLTKDYEKLKLTKEEAGRISGNVTQNLDSDEFFRDFGRDQDEVAGLKPPAKGPDDPSNNAITPPKDLKYTADELKNLSSEYKNLDTILSGTKFTTDNLTNAYKDMGSEVTNLTFQRRNEAGVIEKLSVHLDKHGRVLQDTQKRYRGFASTVARNIAEVAKWTIAVQVIYAPMRKFQELIETMIANEAKLADITVAVGKSQADTSKIFDDAARIAEQTGETINGVLEGYELAYRAAGSITDPMERAATANQLLADSMILSKLSGLDQAVALDTLVGALNQLGIGLTDGRGLLDKWVKVANNANVSLATLAESFAITATSAENAGLSVDELNGIIAVVSENTTLSATEAGNAVRAFISGFETDKAQKTLESFGISIKNTSGEARNFYDVILEINQAWQDTLLSDAELNTIGAGLGGGNRRGAQIVTTIKNLDRAQEVAAVSASAHGDAEEALGIKMDTVQTSIKQLANSFQSLAETLGTEGGVLDITKLIFKILDGGVGIIDGLTKTMGDATPVVLAFALALRQLGQGGAFTQKFDKMQLGLAMMAKPGKLQNLLASPKFGGALLGGGAALGMAGINLAQGDTKAAAFNIGGAIAGGLLTAGNPVGIAIGSAIAGSFATNVLDYEGEFSEFFANITKKTADDAIGRGPKTQEENLADILEMQQQQFFDEVTGGNFGLSIAAALTQGIHNGFADMVNYLAPGKDMQDITRGQAALVFNKQFGNGEFVSQLNQLTPATDEQGEPLEGSGIGEKRNQIALEYADILAKISQNIKEQAQEEVSTGDLSVKKFNELKESLSGLDLQLSGYFFAFGEIVKGIDTDITDAAGAFDYLAEVIYTGSAEDIEYLSGLKTELFELTELLEKARNAGGSIKVGDEEFTTSGLQQKIKDVSELSFEYLKLMNTQQRFATVKSPSIINVDATRGDFQKILSGADTWMQEMYQDLVDNTGLELTFSEWRDSFDGFFVDLGDDMGRIWIEGFSQQSITGMQKTLEEMGEIASSKSIGLKAFQDISMEELQSLAAQSLAINEQLKSKYGQFGYKGETDTFIGVAKDGIAGPINAELTILQMLMRDLIDVNEEQLQGIYNLPADASFFVPFQGYALGQDGGGGGGAGGVWDGMEVLDERERREENRRWSGGGHGNQPEPVLSDYKNAIEELYAKMGSAKMEYKPPQNEELMRYNNPNITEFEAKPSGLFGKLMEAFSNFNLPDFLSNLAGGLAASQTGVASEYYTSQNLKSMEKTMKGSESASNIQELSTVLAKAPINTNFNLNVASNIQLFLDGQVVANVVKQYLHEEIIRQEGTSTITRGVVI